MPQLDNAHALLVGIADYAHVRPLTRTVINDATEIHAALVDVTVGAYAVENVQLLRDGEATQAGLRDALAKLADRTNDGSTVFIYFSGHGGRVESGPHAGEYLVPVDAKADADEALASTCISGAEFSAALRAMDARRIVVIFDCCHAGGIGEAKELSDGGPELKTLSENYYESLTSGRGRVILASSRSDELSWILPGAEHSLFTQHLLDGLHGQANGPGGVIRIFDLFDYVQPRVTQERANQHPLFKAEIEENFAIALYRGGVKEAVIAEPPGDQYEYDAFISYSETKADRKWVRDLVGTLEGQGLTIAVEYKAPLGMPRITFAEQAVAKSRYTVVALSPDYVNSGFAEFQSLIAQHLGQEQSQYRVVPLLLAECEPRLGLRILPILDMSDEEEYEFNLDRLVDYLRKAPAGQGG